MDEAIVKLLVDYWPAFYALAFILFIAFFRLISGASKKSPFLDPSVFKPLVLAEKNQITHNTVWLRFKLPSPTQKIGLPIGQHISFLGKVGPSQGPCIIITHADSSSPFHRMSLMARTSTDPTRPSLMTTSSARSTL
jgi:hypothetical protein